MVLRDFGVGLTENEYILHLDFDVIMILKFLKKNLNF